MEDRLNHFYYLTGCVKKAAEERKDNPVSASEPDLLEMMLKHVTEGGMTEDIMHFKGHFRKQMTFQEVRGGGKWSWQYDSYVTSQSFLRIWS